MLYQLTNVLGAPVQPGWPCSILCWTAQPRACLRVGLVHAVLLTLSAPAKLLWMLRRWLSEAGRRGCEHIQMLIERGSQTLAQAPTQMAEELVSF